MRKPNGHDPDRRRCLTCRGPLPKPLEGEYPWKDCMTCWKVTLQGQSRKDTLRRLMAGQVWRDGELNGWMKVDARTGMLVPAE